MCLRRSSGQAAYGEARGNQPVVNNFGVYIDDASFSNLVGYVKWTRKIYFIIQRHYTIFNYTLYNTDDLLLRVRYCGMLCDQLANKHNDNTNNVTNTLAPFPFAIVTPTKFN